MAKEKGKYEQWLHGFVLPLVAGGDVRISGVMGQRELDELVVDPTITGMRDERVQRIAEARHAVVAEILIDPFEPELEQDSLKLAVAMQNLLFLSHPGTAGTLVRKSKLKQVADWSAQLVRELPPPETVRELAERHSMLHHLFDLGRDDVRVSFWAGRREFKGAEPPPRLLKWGAVRRVREERWRVSFLTEAVSDAGQRSLVLALLSASPLTDLLEPLRLDPPLELYALAPWLREPLVARAVADRYLTLGFSKLGAPLTDALLRLYNQKNSKHECQVATRFVCHLHLLRLLSSPRQESYLPELQALAAGQPALRDFFGLFAAAQRVGLGRPDDVAHDPKLSKLVDAYAAACATLCGAARVLELEGVMSRGVHQLLLAAAD